MNKTKNPYIVEYPATYDIIFHNAFSNKETLASFTSALLNMTIQPEEIEILNPKLSEGINFKTANMDIRYSIIEKMDIDLEMQKDQPAYDMADRLCYYNAQQIVNAMEKGDVYNYKRCCTVCITNFPLFKSKYCVKHFEMVEGNEGKKIRGMEIITIDLTKKEKCDNIELKKWLEIITATNLKKYKGRNKVMDQTIERIVNSNNDKEIQEVIIRKKREEFEEKMKRTAELRRKQQRQQLKELRRQCKEDQAEVAKLRQQCEEDQAEVDKLRQQCEEDQAEVDKLRRQCEEDKVEVEKLRQQYEEDKAQAEKLRQQYQEEGQKIEGERQKVEEERQQLEKLRLDCVKSLKSANMPLEDISKITGLSLEEINELLKG